MLIYREVTLVLQLLQVLVIDHDDAISISGDEEVTDEEDDDDDLPSGLTSLDNSDRPLRENQSSGNGRPVSADRPSSKERSVSSSPLLGTTFFMESTSNWFYFIS